MLTGSYNSLLVLFSLLVAILASYTGLDMAGRISTSQGRAAFGWLVGGSAAMGTGIWSMHFVGMLAFSLPIALGYTTALTVMSWCAAVAVSAIALWVASQGTLTWRRLTGGALAMGAGICAMHYMGMAALEM